MDIVEFRDYCLTRGEVEEKTPFGKFNARYSSVLAFYVEGHIFCIVNIDDFTYIDVKAAPETVERLRQSKASVSDPTNLHPKYWIRIDFDGDVSQPEILELVNDAYGLVKARYSRRRGPATDQPRLHDIR